MKYTEQLKQCIDYIIEKDADWTITYETDNNSICFAKYSPAGQDFFFEIETGKCFKDLINNIREYYKGFDVSYETYLWLDNSGHGKNGAPYDMKELYEDMEMCRQYIEDIWMFCLNFKERRQYS